MKMSLNFSEREKKFLGVIRKVLSFVFYFLYMWLSSAVLGISCVALYFGNNEFIGRYYLISAVYVVLYSIIMILSKKIK